MQRHVSPRDKARESLEYVKFRADGERAVLLWPLRSGAQDTTLSNVFWREIAESSSKYRSSINNWISYT